MPEVKVEKPEPKKFKTDAELKAERQKRQEDTKKNREVELLSPAQNVHIEKCLKTGCKDITEEYAGSNKYLFACRPHNWRATVYIVTKAKDYKNSRFVEIYINKESE